MEPLNATVTPVLNFTKIQITGSSDAAKFISRLVINNNYDFKIVYGE